MRRRGLVIATPGSGEWTSHASSFLPEFRAVTLKAMVAPTVHEPRNSSAGTPIPPPHAGQARVGRHSRHATHHHRDGFMHTKQLANASNCSVPQSGHRATTSTIRSTPVSTKIGRAHV